MSYLDEKGVNKLWTKCKAKFAPINYRPESVIDYGDTNKTIKIGYSGAGLTASQILYIAGYTSGANDNEHKIKDISKDVLKSWLGSEVATGTLPKNSSLSNMTNSSYAWIVFPKGAGTSSYKFTVDSSSYICYHVAFIQGGTPGSIRYFKSTTTNSIVQATNISFSVEMRYIRIQL